MSSSNPRASSPLNLTLADGPVPVDQAMEPSAQETRDTLYYFEDGNVIFQASCYSFLQFKSF